MPGRSSPTSRWGIFPSATWWAALRATAAARRPCGGSSSLYDFGQLPANQKRIAGLVGIRSDPKVSRLAAAPSGFSRGIEITVDFDEDQFRDPAQGVYLFASVLESFFAMYCSINSFSKLTARFKQGERVIKRWLPNAGERYLV